MKVRIAFITSVLLWFSTASHAQSEDSLSSLPAKTLSKYIDGSIDKSQKLEQALDKKTAKAVKQMQKLEDKIQQKLSKIDPQKSKQDFGDVKEQYSRLEQKLQKAGDLQHYIPSLDSLSTSFKFLKEYPAVLSKIKDSKNKLNDAFTKVKAMEQQFKKAEDVKAFLKERRQYIREQLGQLGFAKELKKLNKQVYYYSEQLNEFKSLLKDHKKAEKKALELLSKTKLFRDFMRKNSQLASLFRLPGDPSDPTTQANLAGLQTRAQVSNLIQQRLAVGGPSAQQQFQQNVQSAQAQLNELKNKVTQLGKSSSDLEMPEGFKPNNQKTKTFLQRLEWGTNIQSQKPNGYFPVTSDIGLSLGYKINDKSILGVGASYKMGWGQNIRNINITHQGVGLRSFVDWKIKGSFWMSGGYEMNYRNEINRVDVLKDFNAWQQSGLVGVSKIISLKTKFFKKTKLQLLWDFLSYQQRPQTQAVQFRIGYSFK